VKAISADKKRVMALGGLVLVLIVVMIIRMMPGGGTTALAATSGPEGSIIDRDPQHLACVAKIARARMQKMYTGDDARDPFEPLVRLTSRMSTPAREEEPAEPAPVTLPYMTLYGIIWDPETPIAMIDGMDVHVGDRIKGARIVEIRINRVILEYREKQFELTVD
jgi:hypothetical protein